MEPDYATRPAVLEDAAETSAETTEASDPLAKITMRPRTFAVVLATAALLLGMILALVPVHVAGVDPAKPVSVSCGNTIGGAETDLIGESLDKPDATVVATYVNTCESAIQTRRNYSWLLFFAGALAFAWFGVVRKESSAS